MILIGWKNLIQDKMRLGVTLIGVVFAVVLMMIQSGLFFGFTDNLAGRIDHCPADVWVMSSGALNSDTARPFPEDEVLRLRSIPGVKWAEKLTRGFAFLRLPNGASTWALVYGCNPETGVGGPWEMAEGTVAALRKPDSFIVDESSVALLQGARIGDKLENFDKGMEIVGICRGAKSSNTYPVLFASNRTLQKHSFRMDKRIVYMVAKIDDDADHEEVLQRIKSLKYYEVYTSDEFSQKVRTYWASKTGVGVGIGLTMILAFIVGLVIVGQTMYSATVERIKEFATLKALGASNFGICKIIFSQALIVSLLGYVAGLGVTLLVMNSFAQKVLTLNLTLPLYLFVLVATLIMCGAAAMLSVFRVLKVDPATVFRS